MIKVAGIQFNIAFEDAEENFARVAPMIARAAGNGAELIVLPEMFATGFTMNVQRAGALATRVHTFLANTAARLGITIVGGVVASMETADGLRGKNLAVVYGPDGELMAVYQKAHPFSYAQEDRYFVPGDRLVQTTAGDVRILPLVCYDLRFPELFRIRAASIDLILVLANWPSPRRFAWRNLLVARAIENQAYVLGVNAVGRIGKYDYAGDSVLLDPMGERIDEGTVQGPAIVSGEVDPSRVAYVRRRFPFLRDRRPELYQKLEAEVQRGGDPTESLESS